MGDRANVVVIADDEQKKGETAIFLYGHWSGSELPATLKAALHSDEGKARSTDPSYLARIIFERMIAKASSKETSFGISTTLNDNEYPLLVVDCPRQVVVEYPEAEYKTDGFANVNTRPGIPFADYKGEWKRETRR